MEITKLAVHYKNKENYNLAVLAIVSCNFDIPGITLDQDQRYIYISWDYVGKYVSGLGNFDSIFEYFPVSNIYEPINPDFIPALSRYVHSTDTFLVLLGTDHKSVDIYDVVEESIMFPHSYLVTYSFEELLDPTNKWLEDYFIPLVRKYPHLIFNEDDN